jgi:hypothetical protein
MGRAHRWKALAFLRLFRSGSVGHHQDVVCVCFTAIHLSVRPVAASWREQKTLLTRGKQGVKKESLSIVYLLTFKLPRRFSDLSDPWHHPVSLRLNAQPWLAHSWRVALATGMAGQIVADMFVQIFIERGDIDIKTPPQVTTNIFEGCSI